MFFGFNYKETDEVYPIYKTTEQGLKFIIPYIQDGMNVLDLGTGTGCIGITIKKLFPLVDVTCSDILETNIELAKENGKDLDITFIKSDVLDAIDSQFDLIIFNGPYISNMYGIDQNYYSPDNGIGLYKKLINTCFNNIKHNCYFCLFCTKQQVPDLTNFINRPYIIYKLNENELLYVFKLNKEDYYGSC